MTLLATFSHPVADAQRAFRLMAKAMSEPGVTVSLPPLPAWGNISSAATAVLMMMVDGETPLWIDEKIKDDALLSNIHFHTGAPITENTDASVVLLHAQTTADIASFSPGEDVSLEKSRTLIIDVAGLSGGLAMRLRGPGLMEPRAIAPQLPESVLKYLRQRGHSCPQGLDLIFTCGENMMALPRTTDITLR